MVVSRSCDSRPRLGHGDHDPHETKWDETAPDPENRQDYTNGKAGATIATCCNLCLTSAGRNAKIHIQIGMSSAWISIANTPPTRCQHDARALPIITYRLYIYSPLHYLITAARSDGPCDCRFLKR